MRAVAGILLGAAAIAGCDAYDRDLGDRPFLCGPTEPRCPMGYDCVDDPINGGEVCIAANDSITNDFDCADDSAYEPNETIATATMTPIDTMTTFVRDGLAICPGTDKDMFAITIGASGATVEVLVTYQPGGATLQAAVLNQVAVPIVNATEVSGMPNTIRAQRQNVPAGPYFVLVAGPATGELVLNNYKLTINVTGP